MSSLLLTILFSTLIILLFRLVNQFKIDELGTIAFNYLSAAVLGYYIWPAEDSPQQLLEKPWFIPALFIGVSFIVTFFLLSRSTARVGVALSAVASRMSVIIPVIAGFLLFSDSLTTMKMLGILLTFISFYFVMKPKGDVKLNWKFVVLPLLLLIGIGVNDTAMKYMQHHYFDGDESQFLMVVFFVSFLIGMVILILRMVKQKRGPGWWSLLTGLILGLLNFGAAFFLIRSMSHFETSVIFPVVNMSVVVLSAMIGFLVFKEKLSRVNWMGMAMALVAILMITSG